MNRLRNRLILIFLAATLPPLAATVWITTSLLEWSLNLSAIGQMEDISRSFERTGIELYQLERERLKEDAQAGRLNPQKFTAAQRDRWPASVQEFAESGEDERFVPAGNQGDRLDYLVRRGDDVQVYSRNLGVALERSRGQIGDARALAAAARERNLPRGLKLAYLVLAASLWVLALALLVYLAQRISRPIHQLTAGLTDLAAGDLNARVETQRDDEIGRAIQAFNDMAGKLQESTERLVYLRQLASWQTLARKMAHEVKNSLTPIRLTVEEMLARYDEADRNFMEQATQIVVDEIEALERRVRAFSQFAAEPPVTPSPVDVNSLLQERIAFLKTGHPEVAYDCRLADGIPSVIADQDLVKGILTNLLENAADAASPGGSVLGVTGVAQGKILVEVHDSGPGLSAEARTTLFEPSISFKKHGMGLGLSISRKNALLAGGDLEAIEGELGGAAFRLLLPTVSE